MTSYLHLSNTELYTHTWMHACIHTYTRTHACTSACTHIHICNVLIKTGTFFFQLSNSIPLHSTKVFQNKNSFRKNFKWKHFFVFFICENTTSNRNPPRTSASLTFAPTHTSASGPRSQTVYTAHLNRDTHAIVIHLQRRFELIVITMKCLNGKTYGDHDPTRIFTHNMFNYLYISTNLAAIHNLYL